MSASKAFPVDASSSTFRPSIEPCNHSVQFYQEDRPLIEELARLIGTALLNGDAAIVVATAAHRQALTHELADRDINISKAAAEGRFLALDASDTLARFLVDGLPDAQRFSELIGSAVAQAKSAAKLDDPHLVIFGEMVALLWAEGKHEAAIQLETLWNDLARKHSFTLRCAYPMSGFSNDSNGEYFTRICAEHSAVLPLGGDSVLLTDEDRLRTIAKLQQRLGVLEYEKALRESEQKFRLLVEAVQDYAIFMLDADGRVNSWNVGAERLKGYKASEILGVHFSKFYPPADIQANKPQRELEIAIKDGRVEDEGWRVRKDGSHFWANVVITALKDIDGRLIGYSKVTRDFTERMQAEQELRESKRRLENSEKSLRFLSRHLLRTQDEERRRIGRDLHDSLGQYLSVLKMKLDTLNSAALRGQPPDADEFAECAQLTDDAIKEVRTISYLLYPPMLEEMGLKSAVPWYLEGFTKRSGIRTSFEISPDFGRLESDLELAFFRVLQESLTNVHRHSESPTASVRLVMNGTDAILEIKDQGKGAQAAALEEVGQDWTGALGVGLRGMSERIQQLGGKLDLSSSKEGTTVTATVPLQKAAEPKTASA